MIIPKHAMGISRPVCIVASPIFFASTPIGAKSTTFVFSNSEILYKKVLVWDWYKTFIKSDFPQSAFTVRYIWRGQLKLVTVKIKSLQIFLRSQELSEISLYFSFKIFIFEFSSSCWIIELAYCFASSIRLLITLHFLVDLHFQSNYQELLAISLLWSLISSISCCENGS